MRMTTFTSEPQQGGFSHTRNKGLLSRIPWLYLSRGSFAIAMICSIIHAHVLLLNIARWAVLLLVIQYARMTYGIASVESPEFTGGLFIFTGLYESIMLLMNKQTVLRWIIRFVGFLPIYFQLIHYYEQKLFSYIPLVFLSTPFVFIASLAPAFYGVRIFTRLLQLVILVLTVATNYTYSRRLFLFLTRLLPHHSRIQYHRFRIQETAWENTLLSGFFVAVTMISDFYFKKGPHLTIRISLLAFIMTCGILGCILMLAYHSLQTEMHYWREWLKVLVTICVSLNLIDWVYSVKLKVLTAMDLSVVFLVVLLIVFILVDYKVILSAFTLIVVLFFLVFSIHDPTSFSLSEVQLLTAIHGILCHFSVIGTLLYLIHTRTIQ